MVAALRALAGAVALVTAASAAAASWDEPFAAPPAELLSATAALPTKPGDGVAVLLEEGRWSYDADARASSSYRLVYRVLDMDGIAGWGSMSAGYEPSRSKAPTFRARVIAPDGSVRELDPATIDEGPAHDDVPDVLTTDRVLRAPLPGLVPGCVVEMETRTKDVEPLAPGIASGIWTFGFGLPLRESRVTIEAPSSLPVTFVPRLFPGAAERSEADGRTRSTWRMLDIPRREPTLLLLGPDAPRAVRVGWTSAPSWGAVAEAYAAMVDRQLAGIDVTADARTAAGGATGLPEAAAGCLAWIHARVRYTGLEFGEAAIVPATPQACLARGYGDCKDKATLLVAMLRSLGHRADVALLQVASAEDVDPDLPSLGVFNHAIVAAGDPPLFIDATVPEAAVGELPSSDLGRRALVARKGTSGLVRLPDSSPARDRVVETVEMVLAESGKGAVSETTESWGLFAVEDRISARNRTPKDLQESLDSWCSEEWLGKGALDPESSEAGDLRAPTKLKYSVKEPGRTATIWPVASAALPHGGWYRRLLWLVEEEDETPTEETRRRLQREAERTQPIILPERFAWERRIHVVPPPGYRIEVEPAMGAWTAGPVTFTSDVVRNDDGSITAGTRFDTGDGVLKPADLAELRKRLKSASEDTRPLVHFAAESQKRLDAGDVRGALSELRRLAALHPAEGIHHEHLARVLLQVGLGESALAEARAAVAAEPKSARARVVLADVLLHDSLGRRLRAGSDRDAAVAELKKAKELAPDDMQIRRQLAGLLTLDARGAASWSPAAAREALEELRGVLAVPDEDTLETRREAARAAFLAGDHAAAVELVSSWKGKRSIELDCVAIAALAISQGSGEAIRGCSASPFQVHPRSHLLRAASIALMQTRRYPEAAALVSEAVKGSDNAVELGQMADLLRATKAVEPAQMDETKPGSALLKVLLTAISGDPSAVERLVSRHVPADSRAMSEKDAALIRRQFQRGPIELAPAVISDLAAASTQPVVEAPSARSARVELRSALSEESRVVGYLHEEDGAWRVVSVDADAMELGHLAHALCLDGQHSEARIWIDWARSLPDGASNVLYGPLLPQGEVPPARIRLAAALLTNDANADVLRELRAARESTDDADLRRSIDLALARKLEAAGSHEEAAQLARTLVADEKAATIATQALLVALAELGRYADIVKVLDERLAAKPGDADLLTRRAGALAEQGLLEEALAGLRAIETKIGQTKSVANNIAWFGLIAGEPVESLLPVARAGSKAGDAASLHTLATLLAEAGRPVEARQALLQAVERRDGEPQPSDWYVLGRIAESYGEIDAARAAHERAAADPADADSPVGVQVLARRRLAALATTGD